MTCIVRLDVLEELPLDNLRLKKSSWSWSISSETLWNISEGSKGEPSLSSKQSKDWSSTSLSRLSFPVESFDNRVGETDLLEDFILFRGFGDIWSIFGGIEDTMLPISRIILEWIERRLSSSFSFSRVVFTKDVFITGSWGSEDAFGLGCSFSLNIPGEFSFFFDVPSDVASFSSGVFNMPLNFFKSSFITSGSS